MTTIILLISFVVILLGYIFYKWAIKNNQHFVHQNIKSLEPKFLIGNNSNLLLRKKSQADYIQDLYDKFPEERLFGMFDMRRPVFFIRDPEIVKQLAVKEFDHFIDHRVILNSENDSLFGKSLISLSGHAWKDMRGTLSPAFTGSKMKLMFDLVSNCGNEMTKFLVKDLSENQSKQSVELKDLFARFANDVIATCAFGIEINSLENRKNEFYTIGEQISNFGTFWGILKFIGFLLFPWLMKKLKITLFSKHISNFFHSIITDTIKLREKDNIIRPDMINLLMIAKKGQLKHSEEKIKDGFATVEEYDIGSSVKTELSDDDIVAQCFLFFFAGFDTVSTVMSFIAIELAMNPDIQEKLIAECDYMRSEINGEKLTYDSLQKMKYMDMVISEGLRKWPPAPVTDRLCVKDYDLKYDDINVQFIKDDYFMIPIYAFHHDPKYFPNPSKFDPERFNDENKHRINPLTYLPFGVGPRNCIGSRFALMEIKAVMYYLLLNFTFEISEKTELPLKMGVKKLRMIPDNGIWLSLKPRQSST